MVPACQLCLRCRDYRRQLLLSHRHIHTYASLVIGLTITAGIDLSAIAEPHAISLMPIDSVNTSPLQLNPAHLSSTGDIVKCWEYEQNCMYILYSYYFVKWLWCYLDICIERYALIDTFYFVQKPKKIILLRNNFATNMTTVVRNLWSSLILPVACPCSVSRTKHGH